MLVAKDASFCRFELGAGSRVYVFGGMPFPEKRHIDWNFVSVDSERMMAVREASQAGAFEAAPGEDDRKALPILLKTCVSSGAAFIKRVLPDFGQAFFKIPSSLETDIVLFEM